eukprot:gb/GEZN01009013.1/.p1 GENE.gb/GEZN01009013.1/~~gb/GEZN01009013.1/.p1  ORF type:complete len:273 (+),score=54.41 gb/GEZN01009013.1/:130-948(+)
MSLFPPEKFGMVEDELYRSDLPSELNFPFLETLRLKKLLYLDVDPPSKRLLTFCEDHEIKVVHMGKANNTAPSPWKAVSEDLVIAALNLILDRDSYPLLLMDRRGRHVTGTVVACLRKVQRWNLASILAEYRRYADRRVRVMNEQFIELFDTDLVTIPPNAASYLKPQQTVRPDAPPSLQSTFSRSNETKALKFSLNRTVSAVVAEAAYAAAAAAAATSANNLNTSSVASSSSRPGSRALTPSTSTTSLPTASTSLSARSSSPRSLRRLLTD